MSDYFQHWLDMGERLAKTGAKLPKIFTTNWFRKGADGKFHLARLWRKHARTQMDD